MSNIMHRDFSKQRSFRSMLDDNIKCFRCNWYGHKSINYRSNIRPNSYTSRNAYTLQIGYDVRYFNCRAHGHIEKWCKSILVANHW